MARLYILAEGQTEQTFASAVLSEHLAARGVYVYGPILIAKARKKGKVHRGGVTRYPPIKNDILRVLKQEPGGDVFFTTMIDLYGLPNDFPGWEEADKVRHLPRERVRKLEGAFAADIGDQRFIPYIQLHEFEAILFADPAAFGYAYDKCDRQIAALRAITDAHSSPEEIDDGEATAPSKRIFEQFPDYAKVVFGPQIAEIIGLETIRQKCPHFHDWLSKLEALGPGG